MKKNDPIKHPDTPPQSSTPDTVGSRIRTRSASLSTQSPPGKVEAGKSVQRHQSPKANAPDAVQLSELKRSVLSRKRHEKKEVQEYWMQVRSKNSPLSSKQTQVKSPKAILDHTPKSLVSAENKRLNTPPTKQERKSFTAHEAMGPEETPIKRRKTVETPGNPTSSDTVADTTPGSDQQSLRTERITTRKQAMRHNVLTEAIPIRQETPHTQSSDHTFPLKSIQDNHTSSQLKSRTQTNQRDPNDKVDSSEPQAPLEPQSNVQNLLDDIPQTSSNGNQIENLEQQVQGIPSEGQLSISTSPSVEKVVLGEKKPALETLNSNFLKLSPFARFPSQQPPPLFLNSSTLLQTKHDVLQLPKSPLPPSITKQVVAPFGHGILKPVDSISVSANSTLRSLLTGTDRSSQDNTQADSATTHIVRQSRVTFQDLSPNSVDLVLSPPPPLTPFTGSWEPTLRIGSCEIKDSIDHNTLFMSLNSPVHPRNIPVSSASLIFPNQPQKRMDELQKTNTLDQLSAPHVEYILQALQFENSASPRGKHLTSPTSADSYYMRKKKYARYLGLLSPSSTFQPLSEAEFHLKAAALQGRLLGFQTSHGPSPRDGRPPVASNIFRLQDPSERRKYLSNFSGVESDRLVGLHWIPCIQSAIPRTPKRTPSTPSTTLSSQKPKNHMRKERPEIQTISVAPISPPSATSSAFAASAMISPVKQRPTEVESRDESGSDQDSHASSVATPKPVERKQNIFWNDIETFFKAVESEDFEILRQPDESEISSLYKVPALGNLESEIVQHGIDILEFRSNVQEYYAKSSVEGVSNKEIGKDTQPISPREGEFDPLWIIQKMLSSFPVMEPMSPNEQEPCRSPDDDSHIVPKENSGNQNSTPCEARAQITKEENMIDDEPDEVLDELIIKQQKLREVFRSNNEMKAQLFSRLSPMLAKFNFERQLWDAYERVEADYIRTQEILQRNTPRGPRKKRRFSRRYSSSASLEADFANRECISPSSSSNPADTRPSSFD